MLERMQTHCSIVTLIVGNVYVARTSPRDPIVVSSHHCTGCSAISWPAQLRSSASLGWHQNYLPSWPVNFSTSLSMLKRAGYFCPPRVTGDVQVPSFNYNSTITFTFIGWLGRATKCKNRPIWGRNSSYCQKFPQDSRSVFRFFLADTSSQRQPLSSWASSASTESSAPLVDNTNKHY